MHATCHRHRHVQEYEQINHFKIIDKILFEYRYLDKTKMLNGFTLKVKHQVSQILKTLNGIKLILE